jgi:predicted Zn-dependent peptidase
MAVIAVGDLDRARTVELIERHFASIPVSPRAPPRPTLGEHGGLRPQK